MERVGRLTKSAIVSAFALVLSGTLPLEAGAAQSDFYSGKTITVVVGFGAGGGYGLYAQTLLGSMPKHIPGQPSMVIQYMPGGSGLKAANYLYSAAVRDGSVLAFLGESAPVDQKLRPTMARYNAAEFTWIGRMASSNSVLMVNSATEIRHFRELMEKEVIIGVTGPTSNGFILATFMNSTLNTQLKFVRGYRGSADINLAMERREVDAQSSAWLSWASGRADWIRDGQIIPVVQIGLTKLPDLPHVPLLQEFITDADSLSVLEFISSSAAIGRALSAVPGVPAERIALLREAFDATMRDPEFQATAKARSLIIAPARGAEVQEIVEKIIAAPDHLVERARSIVPSQ